MTVDELMTRGPVIPVLTFDQPREAVRAAQALVAGGVEVLEITLRTPTAIECLAAVAQVPGAIAGAGTVLNAGQVDAVAAAGARFLVSPGLTKPLASAARASGLPFLPGVATATDIMRGLDQGFSRFKFFPATAAGGLPALKALCAPFTMARFCPTGGVNAATAPEWLSHRAVACVGGSWLYAGEGDPSEAITARARAAAALRAA
jgi:2-dehydro-3-deoxyphosphogluconate aldolase/(4S)-4-hydroxy-2-oxoglutarate aldolase